MTPSDHFNGKTFFQPGAHPARSFGDVLRWKLTSHPARWPKRVALPPVPPLPRPTDGAVVGTWLGHATVLLQTVHGNVLFDPVFSERVSPFTWIGPRRVHPPPIPLEQLPKLAAVCLTHDHYDHCDAATLRTLAEDPALTFIAPLRHEALLKKLGARNVVELDWWDAHRVAPGLEVRLTPAKHWTKRLGTPRNHRLWGGYFVAAGSDVPVAPARRDEVTLAAAGQRRIWLVGDSGYDEPLFREVKARCGAPDLAFVPIGAYEPRWFMAPMHMNPEEAVRLHRDSGSRVSIGVHWGTFQLTDEGREEPVRALVEARARLGVPAEAFRVLAPGGSVVVGRSSAR